MVEKDYYKVHHFAFFSLTPSQRKKNTTRTPNQTLSFQQFFYYIRNRPQTQTSNHQVQT